MDDDTRINLLVETVNALEVDSFQLASEMDALEAERDALREALESIAANTCCDRCQEAALVARAALAKGKSDE